MYINLCITLNIIRTWIRVFKCTAITPINRIHILSAKIYEHNTNTHITSVAAP